MSKFIVDKANNKVMATTDTATFQLWNESIIKDAPRPLKKDTWYDIANDYSFWVLENEFPTYKSSEFITVEYI